MEISYKHLRKLTPPTLVDIVPFRMQINISFPISIRLLCHLFLLTLSYNVNE